MKLKSDDTSLLISLSWLAHAYLDAGRVDEAIELLTRVVEISKMKLEPEVPLRQLSEAWLAEALRREEIAQSPRVDDNGGGIDHG
jgi:hypothetical protein